MIYDKIDNLETYIGLSEGIRLGLEWLRDVNPAIEIGVYELSPKVRAIVSEYTTKEVNEYGYEAHSPRRTHATVMCEWASEGEESGR